MTRSCAAFCPPWITRVGNSRRSCTFAEQRIHVLAARQRAGKDVCRRHRILNRQVDADPADRRHGMRRIADREQARLVPGRQPVELHGQQMQVGDLVELGEIEIRWSGRSHLLPDRVDSALPDRPRQRPSGSGRRIANNRRDRSSRASARARRSREAPLSPASAWRHGTRTRPSARPDPPAEASPRTIDARPSAAMVSGARTSRPSFSRTPATLPCSSMKLSTGASISIWKPGKASSLDAQEVEEFPLRHHRNERRRRVEMRQVADRPLPPGDA